MCVCAPETRAARRVRDGPRAKDGLESAAGLRPLSPYLFRIDPIHATRSKISHLTLTDVCVTLGRYIFQISRFFC